MDNTISGLVTRVRREIRAHLNWLQALKDNCKPQTNDQTDRRSDDHEDRGAGGGPSANQPAAGDGISGGSREQRSGENGTHGGEANESLEDLVQGEDGELANPTPDAGFWTHVRSDNI